MPTVLPAREGNLPSTDMVTRFEAVSLGWEVAKAAGFEPVRGRAAFRTGNENAKLTALIHEIYEDEGLEQMTRTQAKRTLADELHVQTSIA